MRALQSHAECADWVAMYDRVGDRTDRRCAGRAGGTRACSRFLRGRMRPHSHPRATLRAEAGRARVEGHFSLHLYCSMDSTRSRVRRSLRRFRTFSFTIDYAGFFSVDGSSGLVISNRTSLLVRSSLQGAAPANVSAIQKQARGLHPTESPRITVSSTRSTPCVAV